MLLTPLGLYFRASKSVTNQQIYLKPITVMFLCRTYCLVPRQLKCPCLVLILMYFLLRSALSVSFTRNPGDPLIVVLNSNSSNVELEWDFSLANGETLQTFYFRRHEKEKNPVLSRVTIGGTFVNPNATLYNMDTNISPGPSSGYIRFTIKDIMKQKDNKDGSEANPLSIDYVYSLWIKTSISDDEIVSYVELKVLVPPIITMYGCQGCVNGSVIENQTITLFCNATGKPVPNIRWTKNEEPYNVSSPGNTLVISPVTREDKGNYTCIADNGVGIQDNKTIPILVKCIITPVCKINNETTSAATVNERDEVVLQCDISGNETYYSYRWLEVKNSMPRNISSAIQLRFDSINRENEAQYQVTIKDKPNCFASQRRSFNITVNYKPENTIMRFSSDKKVFCEGNSTQVNCTADGKPDPVYSLYRNNEYQRGNQNGVFLVTFTGKGNYMYTCVPNNTAGVGPNKSQNVTVKGPLNSEMCTINNKNISHIQVSEMSLVDLRLVSSELERLDFTWKNGTAIMDGKVSQNITIGSITRHEGGTYRVVARDRFNCSANVECSFTVDVHYPPDQPIISSSANKATVVEGETVNLTCKAKANPKPYYLWIFKGKVLHGESNDTISLSNINPNDAGDYTCVAFNYFGNSTATTNFMVEYFNEPSCEAVPAKVKEGAAITLNCSVAAYPAANYTWNIGMEHTATVNLTASPELDKKTFTCTVANYRESKNCTTAPLEVLYQPRYVRILAQDVVVNESGVFNLTCVTSSNPASNYTWSFNGKSIEGANSRLLVKQNFSRYDAGKYQCTVSNGLGTAYNVTDVKVQYPPKLKCADKVFVIEGRKRSFFCNTSAYPDPEYTIRYNLTDYASSSLPITLLRSDNGSLITCTASNLLDSVQCTTVLIVTYPPDQPVISSSANKSSVVEGETVNLTCKAEANPKPYYLWIFKEDVLHGESNDTISISNITSIDAGKYMCVAVNDLGKSMAFIDLPFEYFKEPSCEAIPTKVEKGAVITLKCSVAANPAANYAWNIGDRTEHTATVNLTASPALYKRTFTCTVANNRQSKNCTTEPLKVLYLDDLEVIGSSNKSYSQSNPVVLFNLSVNAYPSNTTLTCNPSVPNIMTVITSHNAGLHTKQYLVVVIIQNDVNETSIVCKAQNTIGVQEKKLHIYRQPIFFRTTFGGQFTIKNQDWQDELKDAKSAVYNDLRKKCIKIIRNAYNGLPYLAGVNIKEFLKGSTIVRFELEVIGQVSDPLLPLRDYIKRQGGEMDGLQIDYNSIQKSSDVEDDSPIPVSEDNETLVAVLGTLLALSIVLNVLLIAGFLWLRRKDSRGFKKRSNNGEEMGQMNDISLQETSLNDIPNVPEYEPIGRRGLAASNSGIPEYEGLSRRTQPAQPQSAVETNNAMPQYESTDRHRLPGTDSNTPSVTYQTIQPRTGDYGSLSPSTRLPPKGTSTGSPTRTGDYQALQHKGVAPQYQSLDDLSSC